MRPLEVFAWGTAGSVAVEIVALVQAYARDGEAPLPRRYRRVGYWLARAGLAGVAGALTLAYGVETPLLALNIGAATPMIVRTFLRSRRPTVVASVDDGSRSPAP